ncbi:hypothetical protein KH172YL63_27310 [Bacillus sp. KH172YL63]|nr:hypothetical protein KH172YL63_27310 [Bacillus sp. KH172YL63]
MCLWKQWKLPKTKVRNLIALGVPKWKAYEWGNTRKGILEGRTKSNTTQNPWQFLLESPRAPKSYR